MVKVLVEIVMFWEGSSSEVCESCCGAIPACLLDRFASFEGVRLIRSS